MKWTNPGHQLDSTGAQLLAVKSLYIYGVDEKAGNAYAVLQWLGVADELDVSFVLDITVYNKSKQRLFCDRPIVPFQTALCDRVRKAPDECAVALPWIAQSNESAILQQLGLKNLFYLIPSHNRRDNFIQNFVCVWLMYKHGKLLSHWTNFLTTLKCNLNCKHCLNFNEFLKDVKHVTFEEFKEHIDTVFSKFDYVYSLHFTGGEPLLVSDLPRFIRYLAENYRDRIFEFFIISNATIVPNEEILSAMKEMRGAFLLDDYSATVRISKVDEIKRVLKARDVNFTVNKVEHWYDLDFDNTDNRDTSEEALECYKDSCNSCLHEFADKRIYACCYQQYAQRAGMGTTTPNDYIDIPTASKMEILEFRQGYTTKGYVDFCKNCRGIGSNAKRVTPAIQIPRKPTIQAPKADLDAKETVSICVPIYNTEKYLVRCIDSLITQTYNNLEIVLVDDGSTDNCGLICDEYAKQDPRVKVFHQGNKGEAGARNAGLHAATGTYVMFIDSDDEYLPNAVQLLVDAIHGKDVDLAIGGYLEKRGEIEHFATGHQRRYFASDIARAYLTSSCQFAMPYIASTINAKLFKRKIITDYNIAYDERFVIGNDSVFMCEYLKHTNVVYDVFSPIYIYYKFQPEERVQGMAWYYPDGFFLFAYVADKMIQLARPNSAEYKELIGKQYLDFLYALVNAITNEARFQNGIQPYLDYFFDRIDFLQACAKLDMAEDFVKKEDDSLPVQLVSALIVNKRYKDLHELLKFVAQKKQLEPYHGTHSRQMIHLHNADTTDVASSTGPEARENVSAEQANDASDSAACQETAAGFTQTLTGEIDMQSRFEELEAQKAMIASQQAEIDQYRNKISSYKTEIASCRVEIDRYRKSASWRITKPLRKMMSLLRRK